MNRIKINYDLLDLTIQSHFTKNNKMDCVVCSHYMQSIRTCSLFLKKLESDGFIKVKRCNECKDIFVLEEESE